MTDFNKILENFKGKRILIIGDVMLDRYLEGSVDRINPEAPVPIVSLKNEFNVLGGAANVASNIVSLSGEAILFGFVGNDINSEIIKRLLNEKGIKHFLEDNSRTIVKTRVMGGNQQLLRFDHEDIQDKFFNNSIKQQILEEAKNCSIILISDYAKGSITEDLMNILNPFRYKIIVDPKPKNKKLYKKVLLLKLNEVESFDMSSLKDPLEAGKFLRKELNSDIIITRGSKGMSIFSESNLDIPTYAEEVYDVTGAGDSVVATLAMALSAGANLKDAVILANLSAGIKVSKKGTYSVNINELMQKINFDERKILNLEELKNIILDLKKKGKKIVWTNGCFDILHVGHIKYLKEAKKLGDILIVGINSDHSVKQLKGQARPIQNQDERAEILSSLKFIDLIIIFPDLNCSKYLEEISPDVYAKGGDYSLDFLNKEELSVLNKLNAQIVFIPFIDGKSSSNIINKIVNK